MFAQIDSYKEFDFLELYLKNNCYPCSIFQKSVKRFLNQICQPLITTALKKIIYFTSGLFCNRSNFFSILNNLYLVLDVKLILVNPLKIYTSLKFIFYPGLHAIKSSLFIQLSQLYVGNSIYIRR